MFNRTLLVLTQKIFTAKELDEARKYLAFFRGLYYYEVMFSPTNSNLYAYGANSPVCYTDPDGNQSLPFMTPEEFFGFLFNHDPSAKAAKLYADAATGNKQAQALAKDITKEAGKKFAADSLEGVATVAEFSGEVLSDLSLESALIQPELSVGVGTASTVCSGVEVAARAGKAAITGKQEDIDKAKKETVKNVGSLIVGAVPGLIMKKVPEPVTNLAGNISSKVFENRFDKEMRNQEAGK